MEFNIEPTFDKQKVFESVRSQVSGIVNIASFDDSRPWGGFFVVEEDDAEKFIDRFFPDLNKQELLTGGKLSPKFLLVAPGKRLSWQYHHRRAEVWKLIGGEAGVVTSDTDAEKLTTQLEMNKTIRLQQGERHRLIGLENWGIVAEIWCHTDPSNPSNEDDIIRLQDDFRR